MRVLIPVTTSTTLPVETGQPSTISLKVKICHKTVQISYSRSHPFECPSHYRIDTLIFIGGLEWLHLVTPQSSLATHGIHALGAV